MGSSLCNVLHTTLVATVWASLPILRRSDTMNGQRCLCAGALKAASAPIAQASKLSETTQHPPGEAAMQDTATSPTQAPPQGEPHPIGRASALVQTNRTPNMVCGHG